MDATTKLPDGWKWIKLKNLICEVQSGFASGERDSNGVIQLRMNNVDTRGNLLWNDYVRVPADKEIIEQYQLIDGDVVFNNTNSVELVGKSALFIKYIEPVVYSNHFTRLRVKSDVLLPRFLSAWLNYQWKKEVFANICNRWIGQSAVKPDKLLSLDFPLPPLAEQKRIAKILNEQLAAVEKARKAAQAQLEVAKTLPNAYLNDIFDSEDTKTWPIKKSGQIIDIRDGTHDTPQYVESGIPLITSKNLISRKINFTGALEISESDHRQIQKRSRVEKYDVLLAMIGTIGNPVIVDTDVEFSIKNVALFKMANNSHILPKYLCYMLESSFIKKQFEQMAQGGMQKFLSLNVLRDFNVLLPSLLKQKQIIHILDKNMKLTDLLLQSLNGQFAELDSILISLLSRAFQGEL